MMATSSSDDFAIRTDSRGRFECPWRKWKSPGTLKLLHWKFMQKSNCNIPGNAEEIDKVLPVIRTDIERLKHPPGSEIQITWIGHATLLVQFDGITILTDPVFRNYCGPEVAQKLHLGFQRYRKPPILIKDIPNIDIVIVTHDHFDHLDTKSVEEINENFPNVKWFIGKNGGDLCQTRGANIIEMTWWEEKALEICGKQFLFACTPTQHWCRRSAFDLNKRLWCSWVIKGPTKSFFFVGDSGYYAPVFQKIGEVYGPFSLSGIPIGCYEPRSILEYQHVCPEEAAKIHYDAKSEYSVSMHWGTFKTMALEFYLDPPQRLDRCMGKDRDKFISLHHGETWVVGTHRERSKFLEEQSTIDNVSGQEEIEVGDT